MNRSRSILLAAILVSVAAVVPPSLAPHRGGSASGEREHLRVPMSVGLEDDADARDEMEFLMQRDPRTNAIPRDIRRRELGLARTLIDRRAQPFRPGRNDADQVQALDWVERGPKNIGGRTRALAVDVANPTILIAGSVGGGIWRSLNDGASWSPRTAPGQIHNTTCIAQDKRAGKTKTWYVGTGELRGSTTNQTRWGALYLGDGIFKSTDNGATWSLLPSTSSATPQTTDPFDYVNNVATNPANLVQDEVLAATYRGIYRSVDGGGTWTQVVASDSGYADVASPSVGVMYATTRIGTAGRLWRSTNGTTWAQIQPPGLASSPTRTVLALAPSNPGIAYAFVFSPFAGTANGHQF